MCFSWLFYSSIISKQKYFIPHMCRFLKISFVSPQSSLKGRFFQDLVIDSNFWEDGLNQRDKPTTCQKIYNLNKVSDLNNNWEYFFTEYPTFVDPISKNQPTFVDSVSESQLPPHSPPLENSCPRNTLDSSSNNPAQITLESSNNIPQNPNHTEIISPTHLPTQKLIESFAHTYSRRKIVHK